MENLSSSFSSFYTDRFAALGRYGFRFLYKVYQTGKTSELCSFILWELLYRVNYYRSSHTLRFTAQVPLTIDEVLSPNSCRANVIPGESDGHPTIKPAGLDWKLCMKDHQQTWWGCEFKQDTKFLKSRDSLTSECVHTFPASIRSLFVGSSQLLVCAGGVVYRSDLARIQFAEVFRLQTNQSYFLFNNGCCELPNGTLLLGEYASVWQKNRWLNLASLYVSKDGGSHWEKTDFLQQQGVNKHIHLVKYSARLNQLFLTDGDNKKQLWRNEGLQKFTQQDSKGLFGWQLLNRFHWQMGGYTSMLNHDEGVMFGTDYLGGTNFMVHTDNGLAFRREVIPNPYRRSPVINMVARKNGSTTELWALLHNSVIPGKSCLLMYSTDNGTTWNRFIDYDGRQFEIQLVSSAVAPADQLFVGIRWWQHGIEHNRTYFI